MEAGINQPTIPAEPPKMTRNGHSSQLNERETENTVSLSSIVCAADYEREAGDP